MQAGSVALIFASVVMSSAAQIILKMGMMSGAVQGVLREGPLGNLLLTVATSPLVLAGLVCFGLSAVLWLFVLSHVPLSSAYPFVSLGILVTVCAGALIFAEPISLMKSVGVALVITGVCLVGIAT